MLEQASPLRNFYSYHFMSQYSMAPFVVGGVIKLNKLTWLPWQTCRAAGKQNEDERRERDLRADKVEKEGKHKMSKVLIELHKKGGGLFLKLHSHRKYTGASSAV